MDETAQPAKDLQITEVVDEANDGAAGTKTPASQNAGGMSPQTPQYSCISGSNNGESRQRTDSRGTSIEKGEKKHKAFFLDEVKQGASVQEVKEVKSFKNNNGGCRCSVM